jgi:hypothetical protein
MIDYGRTGFTGQSINQGFQRIHQHSYLFLSNQSFLQMSKLTFANYEKQELLSVDPVSAILRSRKKASSKFQ